MVVPVLVIYRSYHLPLVALVHFSYTNKNDLLEVSGYIQQNRGHDFLVLLSKLGFNKNYSRLQVDNNRITCLQIYKIEEVTPLSLKKSA